MEKAYLAAIMSLGISGIATADVVFEPFDTVYSVGNRFYGLDIAVKPDGTLGYVHTTNDAQGIQYRELGVSGGTTVSHSAWNNFAPRLAYDSTGQAHITYYKAGDNDLYHNHQQNGDWQGATKIGDTRGTTDLAIDADDNVHVSWQTATNGEARNHRYRMLANDGNWQSERIMFDSTTDFRTRAGASLLAASSSEAYIFTQSRLAASHNDGAAGNSPYVWAKTASGDFDRSTVPPEEYFAHSGGNDSTGQVSLFGGESRLYSADLMSAAFRGDAIDLAAIQQWGSSTNSGSVTGYVTLYLDVLEGDSTPIRLYDASDASEVSMVIDSAGVHYVFFVAPYDSEDESTNNALWLQRVDETGELLGDNVLLTEGTYDVQNIKAAIDGNDYLHLMFSVNGNEIWHTSALVPEPSSAMLALTGGAMLLLGRRKSRIATS
ncbi:hypothetical protein ACERK3_08430 [Phycisphaerales bacterium AB-hyl4]|uniref:PEP-CTERM protein-sorting domain-containing protein n=1 Tax=Natronomicrosphaera hydrolytica TaxID=3242702 RepID=A0ABV4U3Z1_9BACT